MFHYVKSPVGEMRSDSAPPGQDIVRPHWTAFLAKGRQLTVAISCARKSLSGSLAPSISSLLLIGDPECLAKENTLQNRKGAPGLLAWV
jgi:hypothetical protein